MTIGSSTHAGGTESRCSPLAYQTAQNALDQQLDDIINGCGGIPLESAFDAAFTDGCATALTASFPGPPAARTALIDCIGQALDSRRFACAARLECAHTEYSTLK